MADLSRPPCAGVCVCVCVCCPLAHLHLSFTNHLQLHLQEEYKLRVALSASSELKVQLVIITTDASRRNMLPWTAGARDVRLSRRFSVLQVNCVCPEADTQQPARDSNEGSWSVLVCRVACITCSSMPVRVSAAAASGLAALDLDLAKGTD